MFVLSRTPANMTSVHLSKSTLSNVKKAILDYEVFRVRRFSRLHHATISSSSCNRTLNLSLLWTMQTRAKSSAYAETNADGRNEPIRLFMTIPKRSGDRVERCGRPRLIV